MKRLQAAVNLLFTPTIFPIFLLASLVMAVLGNAVYQLLLERVIKDAGRLALVAFVVLLLLIGLIALLIRREVKSEFLEGKPQPTPAKRLILLVGRAEVCRKAIQHHASVLQDCRLVCSEQTLAEANELRREFAQFCKAVPEIIQDVNDPRDAFLRISSILAILPPEECRQTICDYTGMTAHVSIGMFWAGRQFGTRLQYTPAAYNEKLKAQYPLEPIEVRLRTE